MMRRRLAIFGASAALHLGAVALLVAVAGFGASSAILVDLRDEAADTRSPSHRESASPAPSKRASARIRPVGSSRQGPPAAVTSAPAPGVAPEGRRPAETEAVAAAQDPAPSSAVAPPPPAAAPAAPAPVVPTPTEVSPLASDAGVAGPIARADGSAAPSTKGTADGTGAAGRTDRSGAGASRGESGWSAALGPAGDGQGGLPPEYAPYLERFRRRLAESMRYPLAARRQGLAGTVEIEVLVEPSGRIVEARVIASSSHAVLDEAALDTVKHLPTEPFPDRLPRRPLRIRLPLAFQFQ
jgi:TonB family protein